MKQYYKGLDGIRAIAVIFILLFHSELQCFKALWVGVPVFFVLSGFLITGILIQNKEAVNYFKVFYFRRTLRIFPIYYLLLFTMILFAYYIKAPTEKMGHYFFYVQSFIISHGVKHEFCHSLFAHTWSLSVEELFYLFWPFLIWVTPRRFYIILFGAIAVFSVIYKIIVYPSGYDNQILLSIFGNLDALMAGAIIFLFNSSKHIKKINYQNALLCSGVLFAGIILLNTNNIGGRFIYLFALQFSAILFSVSLIIYLLKREIFLFSSPLLTYIGRISYGLYLYHYIVYAFVVSLFYHYKVDIHPILLMTVKIGTSIVIASLSYHIIESFFLKYKDKLTYQFEK